MDFFAAVSQLNPAQREAVEHLYGPMLVLAGPGTGKTQVLTTRIANLLQADVGAEPQNILCLTFTESGAVTMRNRLIRWIGPEAYRVKISTFHGFCQSILDDYPSVFRDKLQNKTVADDLDKALAYQRTTQSKSWNHFKPLWDEFYYRIDFLMALSSLKREHLTPETFLELLPKEKEQLLADPENFYKRAYKGFQAGDMKPNAEKKVEEKIEKMEEFAEFWKTYEKILSDSGHYDFDDQINWVVNELQSNSDLRFDLQEQYQWILVDEYQDTNGSQNDILWALTEGVEDPNLFVVGDDDQSIYRFQGASLANILDFRSHFPSSKTITLTQNYRSPQAVLDTAYTVVEKNTERADSDKKLQSEISKSATITQAEFLSSYTETNYLVQTIQAKLEAGIPPGEIAILVRNNKEIEHYARELPRFEIPVSADISQDIFLNPSVHIVILMLKIFSSTDHDPELLELLHAPHLQIPRDVLLKLSLQANKERKSILEILQEAGSYEDTKLGRDSEGSELQSSMTFSKPEEAASKLQSYIAPQLQKFYEFFIQTRPEFFHLRPSVLAEKVFYESGLAEHLTKQKNYLDFHHIRTFLDWIRDQNPHNASEILEKIELHEQLGIAIRPTPLPADKSAIRILTAHKAKGQEFEVVLIPGLQDKKWGNNNKKSNIPLPQITSQTTIEHALEEERRLFFVALTRAKAEIHLSYSQSDPSGREKNTSQFWHEIPEDLIQSQNTEELEHQAHQLLPTLLHGNSEDITFTASEKQLLSELTDSYIWSVSSLQTYLNCPRQFLFQNLYRFPRKPAPQLALGVALHQALERFIREESTEYSQLEAEFAHALRGQNLEKSRFGELQEHGQEILKTYYEQRLVPSLQETTVPPLLEFDFGKFKPDINGVRITGKVDKVTWLDAEQRNGVIVDYKSGKPRAIKTGESYWRQLVFYDLLAKNSKEVNWNVDHCEIEFLTPDKASGEIKSRTYTVTDEDRSQVIEELKSADTAIKNLEFPIIENPTNDPEIDFWNHFGR